MQPNLTGWCDSLQELLGSSVSRAHKPVRLNLPAALVRMAGMQPGPLTLESEEGREWQSNLTTHSPGRSLFQISKGWLSLVDALQLGVGEAVCLAARSPSRLLISRRGEPHFCAAARKGPPGPWPLTVLLTQAKVNGYLQLKAAAGRTMCGDDAQCVPAVIVPGSGMRSAGETSESAGSSWRPQDDDHGQLAVFLFKCPFYQQGWAT